MKGLSDYYRGWEDGLREAAKDLRQKGNVEGVRIVERLIPMEVSGDFWAVRPEYLTVKGSSNDDI